MATHVYMRSSDCVDHSVISSVKVVNGERTEIDARLGMKYYRVINDRIDVSIARDKILCTYSINEEEIIVFSSCTVGKYR